MTTPVLSAAVLLWNGIEYLPPLIESLRRQTLTNVELLFVDNASTDGTADHLARYYPEYRLIRNETNLGFAGGMNVALSNLTAPTVVLLNQDTVLRPGCLQAVMDAFAAHPSAGVVGGKLLFPDGLTLQHAGGYLEMPLALGQHDGYRELDLGTFDTARTVEYVNGALLGLRRAALDEVGVFDERFWPGYFEEVDLCRRMRDAGWDVLYWPDASLIHHESASFGRNSDRYYVAYHRNRLRFVLKHYSVTQLAAFVKAEEARFLSLGGHAEARALAIAYREVAGEVQRDRPEALPFVRRLFSLQAPPIHGRLGAFRRHFHPAKVSGLDRHLELLRQRWRVVGPPIVPPERDPKGLVLGLLRTASWLIIRWSFLPVLESQDRYNGDVLNTLQSVRDELGGLYGLLGALTRQIEEALAVVEQEARSDPRVEVLERELKRILGELTARVGELDSTATSLDREMVDLRRSLAAAQHRLHTLLEARQ